MYFRNCGPRKTWLDQFFKNPVSENSSTDNMVNGAKHFFHLKGSTFNIFHLFQSQRLHL